MTPTLALTFVVSWLAGGAVLLYLARRARRMRQALQEAIHDRALASDRRCDALQQALDAQRADLEALRARLDTLALIGRIDHLLTLVETAERHTLLAPPLAATLHVYALGLRAEARRERL